MTLTSETETTAGAGVWNSDDNKFKYVLFTESDGSKTLNIISLASTTDRVFVRNFSNNSLGISLKNGPSQDMTVRNIAGDKDFGATGNAQDDLGNPTGNAVPGRGDRLYGAATNDRIQGLGGSDIVIGHGGDDKLYGGAEVDLAQAISQTRLQTGSGKAIGLMVAIS
jgi:Ca2+-binding RTX toxin-like protein